MRRTGLAIMCLAALGIAACSLGTVLEPTPDLSKFYVLTPLDNAQHGIPIVYGTGAAAREIEIGLGPIKFPAYLSRDEIVTRSSANQVEFSPIDRWAEPLNKNFANVLAQNLSILLGGQVTTFPWYRPINLDFQIAVDINRFDTDSQGTARILGHWEIKNPVSGELLKSGDLNITEPAQKGDQIAATLSRALSTLSIQLADAIRAAPRPPAVPKAD